MPTLAFVDDRNDVRKTIVHNVELEGPKGWEIQALSPLPSLGDYLAWITAESVAVLVVDERLNEEGDGADYTGHELAQFIRGYLAEFPIFMITAYEGDEELEKNEDALDAIVNRNHFYETPGKFVARFVRAGQRFFDTYHRQLAEFSRLSVEAATGTLTSDDEDQLRRYCQVEAFGADRTPRCWQRGTLEPHYLAARSELETST